MRMWRWFPDQIWPLFWNSHSWTSWSEGTLSLSPGTRKFLRYEGLKCTKPNIYRRNESLTVNCLGDYTMELDQLCFTMLIKMLSWWTKFTLQWPKGGIKKTGKAFKMSYNWMDWIIDLLKSKSVCLDKTWNEELHKSPNTVISKVLKR